MKKLITVLCSLLAAVMTFGLTACGGGGGEEDKATANSYVSLNINPAIELTVDTDNKVLSVYGANEDGQVLLYQEAGIVGLDVEVAIEKITNLAIELGYLGEGNLVVETSVTTADGSDAALSEKINAKVTATAQKVGLNVTANTEGAYSLLRKFEAFKAENPNNPVINALSEGKFKLALAASETGEVSLEAAVEMDNEELIKMVSEAHSVVEEYATKAYNKAKADAFAIFDIAAGLALDSVYNTFYMKNPIAHFDTVYYGAAYQAYKLSSRVFNATADVLAYVEDLSEYPLDEAVVAEVAGIFGITDTSALKNSAGNVTVASIEAYADKVFKNSQISVDIDGVKAELTNAIAEAEAVIKAEAEKVAATYQPQISNIVNIVNTTLNTVKQTISILPLGETVVAQFTACVEDFNEVIAEVNAILEDGVINEADLREWAGKMETKASDMLTKINADLSDEEKAEVAEMIADLEETLATARTTFEDALNTAEATAKEYLANAKAARKAIGAN